MAKIVRSQHLHKFPLSDLKWSINLTTTTRLGSQAADSTLESPIGDSGVRQIESDSDDRRVWTHCSSLQAARNGDENPAEPTVILDPAIANKTADSSEGSKILIRFRSKEKSSVVEEAEKQPPPKAQARSVVASEQEESTSRVWNLRSRKPSYKKSAANSAIGDSSGVPQDDSASTIRRCTDVSGEVKEEKKKKQKVKLSIALSKSEIEADYMLITGAKPPRRPKKRPRTVQNQLDYIFPGLSLPMTVRPQMYEVSHPAP